MVLDVDEVGSLSKWGYTNEEWDRLVSGSDEDEVFLSRDWLQAWWEVYGEDRRLRIITVRDGGELVGVAPLMDTKIGKLVSLTVREFVGTGQSDYLGAASKGGDSRIQHALWSYVDAQRGWDVLDLREMREDRSTAKAVRKTFGKAQFESSVNPWVPIQGTYEDHLKEFSSNFRHGIVRSWNRLQEDLGAKVQLMTEPEEMAEGLELLVSLSKLRWKGRGRSTLEDDQMSEFLGKALPRLSRRGEVVFHVLKAGDAPIAICLGFLRSDRYQYYLSGFDPEFQGYGPGRSLLAKVLEDCHARGIREMDLLRGDEDYKFRFHPEDHRLVRCRYDRGVKANLSKKLG